MINDNACMYMIACVYIEYFWLGKGKSPDLSGIPRIPFASVRHHLATSCLKDSNEGLPL